MLLAEILHRYPKCFMVGMFVSYRILLLANSLTDVVCYKYTELFILWSMKKEALNRLSSEMGHVRKKCVGSVLVKKGRFLP